MKQFNRHEGTRCTLIELCHLSMFSCFIIRNYCVISCVTYSLCKLIARLFETGGYLDGCDSAHRK